MKKNRKRHTKVKSGRERYKNRSKEKDTKNDRKRHTEKEEQERKTERKELERKTEREIETEKSGRERYKRRQEEKRGREKEKLTQGSSIHAPINLTMFGCCTRHSIETSLQNISTSDFAEKGEALYLKNNGYENMER